MVGPLNNNRTGQSSGRVPGWGIISSMLETGATWIVRSRKHMQARSHGHHWPEHSWEVGLILGNAPAACCAVSGAIHIRQAFCS